MEGMIDRIMKKKGMGGIDAIPESKNWDEEDDGSFKLTRSPKKELMLDLSDNEDTNFNDLK